MKRPVKERFLEKIEMVTESGCWIWMSSVNNTGYGTFNISNVPRLAHRVSYEMFKGKIPKGLVLDHLCRVPACCNPAHLEPVTDRDNFLRGVHPSARFYKENICKRGHVLSEDDIGIWKDGTRICKVCRRLGNRRWWSNNTAELSARRAEQRRNNIEKYKEADRVRGARYRAKQRLAKQLMATTAPDQSSQ